MTIEQWLNNEIFKCIDELNCFRDNSDPSFAMDMRLLWKIQQSMYWLQKERAERVKKLKLAKKTNYSNNFLEKIKKFLWGAPNKKTACLSVYLQLSSTTDVFC